MKKQLLLTSFLISFIFVLQDSAARVIFKNPNIQSPYSASSGAGISLDFNGDGIKDIEIFLRSESYPTATIPTYFCTSGQPVPRDGYGEQIIFKAYNGSGFYASDGTGLATGIKIDKSRTFTTVETTLYGRGGPEYTLRGACYPDATPIYYSPSGKWSSNPAGYLGVKFKINGLWHYGYLKFERQGCIAPSTGCQGQFRITEMAYESIPGYEIFTGNQNGFSPPLLAGTYNTISGKVYIDNNHNCSYDTGDLLMKEAFVYAKSGSNYFYGMTDRFGNYSIDVAGGTATYQLSVSHDTLEQQGFAVTCSPADVNLTGTGNTSSNKNFGIQISNCPVLSASINSDRRRRCFRNNTLVSYANYGVAAASNVVVKIIYPTYVKPISAIPAWDQQSGDTLIFNISSLGAFVENKIKIIDSVICGDESIRNLTQCTKVTVSCSNPCVASAAWDQSVTLASAACQGSQTKVILKNTGSGNMSDSASYRIFLDNVRLYELKYKLNASEEKIILIANNNQSVRVEADLTAGHPTKKTDVAVIEGCGNLSSPTLSKSVINNLSVDSYDSREDMSCMPIRDSYDPNDKQVTPAGFGPQHRTLANQRMDYIVRFQNTGSDTAYSVVVIDTLASELDLATFRVEAASHNYTVEVAGTNKAIVKFIFGGIMLVDKTTNEPGSHGYIAFSIRQKSDLTVGTQIKNKAHIFFDYNSAIITNETLNTIFSGYMKRPTVVLSNLSKTYGDAPFSLALASNSTGAATYTAVNGSSANVASNGSVNILGAGTIAIKGEVAEQGEYVQWSDTMTLTVDQAPLTITAENKNRIEGQANPVLTYSFSGFVYNENESVVSGAPTLSTTATPLSPVGSYPIQVDNGTLFSPNYSFNFVDGSLEVQTVTGILDPSVQGIRLYPNPSTGGQLFIDSEENIEKVILTNSLGQRETFVGKAIQTHFTGLVEVSVYTQKGISRTKVILY